MTVNGHRYKGDASADNLGEITLRRRPPIGSLTLAFRFSDLSL